MNHALSHNPEQCRRRNALATRRGFDAAPVRLSVYSPRPLEGGKLLRAKGTMPGSPSEALDRINGILARSDRPLTEDQIHLAYMEAGSSRLAPSRWLHLHPTTLRNVAAEAAPGFAFMNSHRTGGLSEQGELPFGRTFAGRYERWQLADGQELSRALIGVYALRGAKPNGDQGPSTDDLFAGIDAGTIFDVSLGIKGSWQQCDVCGNALNQYDSQTGTYLCPHVPGTTRQMKPDEIKAQKARGVPGGAATYSLVEGVPGEVSAVFDGAVPGAGFRKAKSLAQRGELDSDELTEIRQAYAEFLDPGLFRGGRHAARSTHLFTQGATPMKARDFLARLGIKLDQQGDLIGVEDEGDEFSVQVPVAAATPPAQQPAATAKLADDPGYAALQKQLSETNARLAAAEAENKRQEEARATERRNTALAGIERDAEAFCEKHKDRLTAKQLSDAKLLLVKLGTVDLDHPFDGVSLSESFKAILGENTPHKKTDPKIAAAGANGAAPSSQVLSHNLNGENGGKTPTQLAQEQNDAYMTSIGRKPVSEARAR